MQEINRLPEGSRGYGQDLWMCLKAREMGLPNIIDGRVTVSHPEGTGYNDEEFHAEMEKVFGEMYGSDFRRTAFQYDDRYQQNLMENEMNTEEKPHSLADTVAKPFTIVTVDNGWSCPDFIRVTKDFPDARKIMMTKGIADIPHHTGIEQIPYDESLSRLISEADVALFPKVGVTTKGDLVALMRAGIPCVVHTDFGKDIVEHMKNGFLYQTLDWATRWIAEIQGHPGHREAVESYVWDDVSETPSEAPAPSVQDEDIPDVTVITPTWNRDPKFIRRCIDSLRLQTNTSWEQVVISNGPREEQVAELVRGVNDPRVSYAHLDGPTKENDFGNSARAKAIS
jgi:hypothetical protein